MSNVPQRLIYLNTQSPVGITVQRGSGAFRCVLAGGKATLDAGCQDLQPGSLSSSLWAPCMGQKCDRPALFLLPCSLWLFPFLPYPDGVCPSTSQEALSPLSCSGCRILSPQQKNSQEICKPFIFKNNVRSHKCTSMPPLKGQKESQRVIPSNSFNQIPEHLHMTILAMIAPCQVSSIVIITPG